MVKFCVQLGKTEGIITILRGVPHNASRLRKVYLPVSVLTEHQVSSESLIRNTVDQEKMKILVESMAAVADDHLGTIHILRKHIFRLFEPPSSEHVFSTENKQSLTPSTLFHTTYTIRNKS